VTRGITIVPRVFKNASRQYSVVFLLRQFTQFHQFAMQSISQSDDDWDNKYSLLCFLFSWSMNAFLLRKEEFLCCLRVVCCVMYFVHFIHFEPMRMLQQSLWKLWQLTRWETALRHHLMTTFPSCVTLMCLTMANLTCIMFHRLLRTRYQSMDQSLYLIDAGRQAEWVCVVINTQRVSEVTTDTTDHY